MLQDPLLTQLVSSHPILHSPKFYSDRQHPRRGEARSRGTLRGCVLVDVRHGHWRVLHLYLRVPQIPRYPLIFTGWCVALGGTTALDTLGSQAFTGGDNPTDVSIHFQRCVVLLWILFIPVAALWIFVHPVLIALGQEEQLSQDVQKFLRVLVFGAPGYIAFESMKKYLQCQGRH